MSRHPNAKRLAALVDGEISPAAARRVEGHLAGCATCRDAAARLGELRARLAALPQEARQAPGDWAGLAAALARADASAGPSGDRVSANPPQRRPRDLAASLPLRLAAGLLIFLAGLAAGRAWERANGGVLERANEGGPLARALAVQRAGAEYIAALAAMPALPAADSTAPDPGVHQAREAAFATFYGAAFELGEKSAPDPGLTGLVERLATLRDHPPAAGADRAPVRF